LSIAPDGGVSRLRLFGRPTRPGWEQAGIRRLDALPEAACAAELLRCCGSTTWARRMAAARPFRDAAGLSQLADDVWAGVSDADRLEAFAAHPRIGERAATAWSRQEQSGAAEAGSDVRAALEAGNRRYEQRFGHVFLICATGRGAEEILAELEQRSSNDADTELALAAEEQRKITALRLAKLLRPEEAS
jgi:allantoicase